MNETVTDPLTIWKDLSRLKKSFLKNILVANTLHLSQANPGDSDSIIIEALFRDHLEMYTY